MKHKFFSRVSSLALAACLSLALAVPAMAYGASYEFPGGFYDFYPESGELLYVTISTTDPVALTIPAVIDGVPVRSVGEVVGDPSLTSLTVSEGIVSFGLASYKDALTEVTLPNSLTELGAGAFNDCDNLVRVTLGNSLTTIGRQTFCGCISLTSITLPSSLTTLGEEAFALCKSLTSITIPGSLTTVEENAFWDCDSLTDVYYYGTPEQWAQITIESGNTDLKNAAIHYVVPVAGFTDVSSGDYYADAVQWAVNQKVTTGTGANTFSPANAVTRAEAVTFLWRAAGSPAPASMTSPFTDVTDPNAYYYKAVLWAAEQGITGGVGDNAFGLSNTLTYDQIFTMLGRASGADLSGSDWSAAAVNWAQSSGLTDGLSFTAATSCPRADVVYCRWKQLA